MIPQHAALEHPLEEQKLYILLGTSFPFIVPAPPADPLVSPVTVPPPPIATPEKTPSPGTNTTSDIDEPTVLPPVKGPDVLGTFLE